MAELLTATEIEEDNVPQEKAELLSTGAEEPVNNSYTKHEARSLDIAASTGLNIFDIHEAVDTGQWNTIDAKLRESGVRQDMSMMASATISEGLQYQEPAEVTAQVLQDRLDATQKIQSLGGFFMYEGLVGKSGNINPKQVNLLTNAKIALEKIEEGFQSANEGGKLATFSDWMDRFIARQLIVGNIEDAVRIREKRSAASAAIMADTDPLEFGKDGGLADQMVEKFANQGVFKDENWYAKMDAIDWVEGGGFNENADVDQFFAFLGVLDVFAVVKGVKSAGKIAQGISRNRSTLREVRDSLRTASPVDEARLHGGVEAADSAVDNSARAEVGSTPRGVDPLLPSSERGSLRPGDTPPVGDGTIERVTGFNRLIKRINELMKKDIITGSIDRESAAAILKKATDEMVARLDNTMRPIFARGVGPADLIHAGKSRLVQRTSSGSRGGAAARGRTENDLWSAKVVFGVTDSRGFDDIAYAKDAAAKIEARGYETNIIDNASDGEAPSYLIEVFENIDPSVAMNAADLDGVTKSMLGQGLGSAGISDTRANYTFANLGEQAYSLLRQEVQAYEKIIKGAKFRDKKDLNTIFENLRDGGGADGAARREMYSESDFIDQWRKLDLANRAGRLPSEKLIDAFWATVTMHDAAWFLEAHKLTFHLHRNGYKGIKLADKVVPARISPSTPKDAVVHNFRSVGDPMASRPMVASKVESRFKDHKIWELDTPWKQSDGTEIKYVIAPEEIRDLRLEDVLPYNAGGRRENIGSNWFLKFGGRAVMGAFSEKDVLKAKRDLTEIQRGILDAGGIDSLTTLELEDLMRGRMAWAPDIQDATAFREVTRNWDWTAKIDNKARGGRLSEKEYGPAFTGLTEGEAVAAVNRRGDQLIRQYGGGRAVQDTSLNAISKQLDSGVADLAYRTYDLQSKVSFLKKYYHNKGEEVSRAYKGNIDLQFNEAFDSLMAAGWSGEVEQQLKSVGATIRRRQGVRGETGQKIDTFNIRMREWVYDKTGYQKGETSIKGKLLSLGFESAFGFLNMSQFFLQASHAAVIIAISPKHGLIGSSIAMPMMGIMTLADRPAALVAKKAMAKALGVPVTRVDEMIEYIENSGRFNVMMDAIQADNLNARLPKLLSNRVMDKTVDGGSKLLEVGRLPFIMGENISRRTAIFTAMSEFMEKFPDVSINSRQGRQWISNREHKLGFDMNAKSRAAWQAQEMAVPTQWLSYSMRFYEALLSKKFDAGERIRIGIAMLMMGGTTSLAGGFVSQLLGWDVTDAVAKKMGMEPGGTAYVAFKYGLFDAIISWATDGKYQTAFGTRMAPITAFTDMYRKLTEEGTITTLGGPSGEIFGNTFTSTIGAISNGLNGNYQMSMMEIERFLRTPTGIDNAAKALGMWNSGAYVSKTGTVMPYDYSRLEALGQGFGMTNLRDAEYYYRRSQVWRAEKDLQKETKLLKRVVHDMYEAQRNGDFGKAQELANNLSDRIHGGGWSPSQKNTLRKALEGGETGREVMVTLIDNLMRADGSSGDYAGEVIAKLYRNTGE